MSSRSAALLSSSAAFLFPFWLLAYSGGPPVRRSAAPGDRSCLDAHCHSGPRFDESAAIELDNGAQLEFQPGGPRQRWRIRINDPARAYGLQLTVRAARNLRRQPAGDLFSVQDLTSVICEDDRFKGPSGCAPEAPVQFFHHTEPRLRPEFEVDWQPPSSAADVAVFVAANASLAGQRSSRLHFRTFILRPAGGPELRHAVTNDLAIGPAAWASLYGRSVDLSGDWAVHINGVPAEIGYRDPRQINLLPPSDGLTGLAFVELLRDGLLATELLAWKRRLAPAFFPTAAVDLVAGGSLTLLATGLAADLEVRLGGQPVECGRERAAPGVERLHCLLPPLAAGSYVLQAETAGVPLAGAPTLVLR